MSMLDRPETPLVVGVAFVIWLIAWAVIAWIGDKRGW